MQIALNENMLIELFNSKKVNPLIVYQITYLSICFTTTSTMVRMACTLCNPKFLGWIAWILKFLIERPQIEEKHENHN